MDTPELWQFTSSHFNEKARWALDFKRVPHIRHSLIPGFHVPVVKRMTGKTHVPVLKLDGTAISDSSRIIEALERAYPEPPLYPGDSDERRRAIELEEYYDEELGPYIRRWIFHVILPYPEFLRALFVSHASPAAQLAQRAMSPLIGRVMRRQMDINPASCRDRAREDDGRDGSAGERGTAVRLPGRRSFHGRRSYGGGPAFAAGQTAGVSVQSRRAASGAARENQGIPLDPSRVPMDASDLSAASRRVGRSRSAGKCLAEQGGWRQDRDSPAAVAPPESCGGKGARGPDRKSTPSKCRGDSERDPRGCRAPFARRRSRRDPAAGNRRRRRHLSSRHSASLRQPRRPGRSDGPAGYRAAPGAIPRRMAEREGTRHRGRARALLRSRFASWNGADARVAYSYRREPPDNEAGPAQARGRTNARGQGSTSAEGRTPLAGAGRVAVRRDRSFYSRARRFLVRPERPPSDRPRLEAPTAPADSAAG